MLFAPYEYVMRLTAGELKYVMKRRSRKMKKKLHDREQSFIVGGPFNTPKCMQNVDELSHEGSKRFTDHGMRNFLPPPSSNITRSLT